MIKKFILILIALFLSNASLAENILRIAGWGGEIPAELFKKFTATHHIKVYFSSFENNESLNVKLRTSKRSIYDLIIPSSYYIPKLMKAKLLKKLALNKIKRHQTIKLFFILEQPYDVYAIPLNWSSTGIFYNKQYFKSPPEHWQDLWCPELKNKLLLLDDTREVFSIALISLGYSPNDENPIHIQQAYQKLLELRPNIKLFASDAVPNLIIDEDAVIGMAWNADIIKAQQENPNIGFVTPEEGYIINTESFAIPKNSEHIQAAYAFINFMMEPENIALMTLKNHFPPTINDLDNVLPQAILQNPILFPNLQILEQGIFQKNVSQAALVEYNRLWEMFKLSL